MSPEQTALVEKARRSLRAARLLLDDGLPEFAVSRAYYTMFYLAEALLLGEGLAYSKHSAVIAAFGKYFARTNRLPAELHAHLREAQDQRNLGDYDTGDGPDAARAEEQILRADQFLRAAVCFMSANASARSESP